MELVHQALRAGRAAADADAPPRSAVLAGGGGALGSAVIEQLLAGSALRPLHVLVTQDFHASAAGLRPVVVDDTLALPAGLGELAVIVFDRARIANGRDAAFLRPRPEQLPALAAALQRAGARDLLVVLPHAAASLPQALQAGLANLDEQAVAALGF
jgi:pyrroline-5-carboxylate reductase